METVVLTKSERTDQQPYQVGDRVMTYFFGKKSPEHCTVTACYPAKSCESGWLVDTVSGNEFVYKGRDSNWFEPLLL